MLRRSLPNFWRLKFWNNGQKTRPLKSWRKHTQIWNIFFRQTVPQFTCVSRMQMSFVRDNICVSHIHTHKSCDSRTTAQLHICLESMSVCPMVKCTPPWNRRVGADEQEDALMNTDVPFVAMCTRNSHLFVSARCRSAHFWNGTIVLAIIAFYSFRNRISSSAAWAAWLIDGRALELDNPDPFSAKCLVAWYNCCARVAVILFSAHDAAIVFKKTSALVHRGETMETRALGLCNVSAFLCEFFEAARFGLLCYSPKMRAQDLVS